MINVEVHGTDKFLEGLSRMLREAVNEPRQSMQKAAEATKDLMKSNTVVRSGSLQESIDYDIRDVGGSIEAVVGPNDSNFGGRPVGRAVELGRAPGGGFPNWFDIANRYGVSTGVAYRMAKTIHEKGTMPGLRFVETTFAQIQPIFHRYGLEVVYRIAGAY